MISMHGVEAIYILMRRVLVLALRLQFVNRRGVVEKSVTQRHIQPPGGDSRDTENGNNR
jgi:hypothetical protein